MSMPALYIGNKNYSSWSFRPWLAMTAAGIPFEERFVPFDFPNGNPKFAEFSPTKTVPALHHDGLVLWESLAIMEYIAEQNPESGLWPTDFKERAQARAISAEMHSGFGPLRSECPMNMRRAPAPLAVSDACKQNVQRITEIWSSCLTRSGGPFLFGSFTNADAMFAPVVSRIKTYQLSDADVVQSYSSALTGLPAWQAWETAGVAEPWIVDEDEV